MCRKESTKHEKNRRISSEKQHLKEDNVHLKEFGLSVIRSFLRKILRKKIDRAVDKAGHLQVNECIGSVVEELLQTQTSNCRRFSLSSTGLKYCYCCRGYLLEFW